MEFVAVCGRLCTRARLRLVYWIVCVCKTGMAVHSRQSSLVACASDMGAKRVDVEIVGVCDARQVFYFHLWKRREICL